MEAIVLQRGLAERLTLNGRITPDQIDTIAGVDAPLSKENPTLTAGTIVLDARTLCVIESTFARVTRNDPC